MHVKLGISVAGTLVVLAMLSLAAGAASSCQRKCSEKEYREDGTFNAAKRNATFDCMFRFIDISPRDGVIFEKEYEAYRHSGLSLVERAAGTWKRVKSWCNCGCTNTLTQDDIFGAYRTCLGPDMPGGADLWIDQAYKRLCSALDPTDLPPPDNVNPKDWKGSVNQ